MSQIDLANLDNRQRAAVQNAQAFLQMDMANLDNEQQATMLAEWRTDPFTWGEKHGFPKEEK